MIADLSDLICGGTGSACPGRLWRTLRTEPAAKVNAQHASNWLAFD